MKGFILLIISLLSVADIFALAPKAGSDGHSSLPEISSEYLMKKLPLLLKADKKPLFIFDVHGTLLKSTWKKEYARLYKNIFQKNPSKQWFKQYIYQKDNDEIMKTLAEQSGRDQNEITAQYRKIRTFFRSGRPLDPIKGGLSFIKTLKSMGFDVIISSRASKEVITKQLTNAGFLSYLEHNKIVGCPDNLRDQYDRSKVMRRFQKEYPDHQLISFDDWDEGVRTVKELGGITFGLPQGEEGELEINKLRLISEGIDFLLKNYDKGDEIIEAIVAVFELKRTQIIPASVAKIRKAS